jgi:hypothetical protein
MTRNIEIKRIADVVYITLFFGIQKRIFRFHKDHTATDVADTIRAYEKFPEMGITMAEILQKLASG